MTLNRLANPSFEDGTVGWDKSDAQYSHSVQTASPFDGDKYLRVTADTAPDASVQPILHSTIPVSARPGQPMAFSIYARGSAGAVGKGFQMMLVARNAANGIITQIFANRTMTGSWARYTCTTGGLPASTAWVDVFIYDTGKIPAGDYYEFDAAMINDESSAATFTTQPPPLSWRKGQNYDFSQLRVTVATPGFIIGDSILGEAVLGDDSGYSDITKDFTSIQVNEPSTVEDGLFIHREVSSCTITTTDPDHLALRDKRILIWYGPKILFQGTILNTSLSESVQVNAPYQRGNTDLRTYRVTLRCSAGEEYFATQDAEPRNFTTAEFNTRLASYLDLGSSDIGPAVDVDAGVGTSYNTGLARYAIVSSLDQPRTIMETFRDLLKRCGRYYRMIPWANRIDTESFSRPASGGDTIESGLRFTDDPTLVGAPSYSYDDATHEERTVSYSERQVSEDASLFTTGITVTTGDSGSEVVHGPFLTSGTRRRQDVSVSLGPLTTSRYAEAVRNWVATLPLRSRPQPFTSRLTAPLQSLHQVQGRVPGIATLNREGTDELVSILGVTHTITPDRWLIEYECGPSHLLTRLSDLDPSPPRELTVTQAGSGGDVTVSWLSPDSIPTSAPVFAQVRAITPTNFSQGGIVPSDASTLLMLSSVAVSLPLAPRTPISVVVPFSSLSAATYRFYVQYTTHSTPADNAFDPAQLIGQPATVTKTLT